MKTNTAEQVLKLYNEGKSIKRILQLINKQ